MSIAAKGVILEIVTLLEAFFHTWNQFENIANCTQSSGPGSQCHPN